MLARSWRLPNRMRRPCGMSASAEGLPVVERRLQRRSSAPTTSTQNSSEIDRRSIPVAIVRRVVCCSDFGFRMRTQCTARAAHARPTAEPHAWPRCWSSPGSPPSVLEARARRQPCTGPAGHTVGTPQPALGEASSRARIAGCRPRAGQTGRAAQRAQGARSGPDGADGHRSRSKPAHEAACGQREPFRDRTRPHCPAERSTPDTAAN
jgi:hypothetical protein